MPQNRQLAYYASLLPGKESQFETPGEGYRIYKDVPIARTGWQEYLGSELKRNRGYKDEWNLEDGTLYKVYRPLAEVTHPATLASFEGKSVLDQHPSGDRVLIDALDEYEGISKGHGQNVRVGATLPDGETPLVADLHVKHPDLNVKVDSGVRDVSCGYTYLLAKDEDGRLIQTQIRGNHIAIVPRGRAGSQVGIKDSVPETEKGITMAGLMKRIKALGFMSWAKDAKPEEVESVIDELMPEKGEGDALAWKDEPNISGGSAGVNAKNFATHSAKYRGCSVYRMVTGRYIVKTPDGQQPGFNSESEAMRWIESYHGSGDSDMREGEGDAMSIKELLAKPVAAQGAYGLTRYSSLEAAYQTAIRSNGNYGVLMGDDGKYWVAPARIARLLNEAGYEYAPKPSGGRDAAEGEHKDSEKEEEKDMKRGAKDEHPKGCYCADCRGSKDAAGLKAAKKAKGAKDAEESEEGKETMAEDKGAKDSWCPTCNGAGERTAGMKCVTCNGTGHVETKPAGTKDSEEAEEKKDDESGDSDEPEVAAAMDAESEIEAEEKEEEAARDAEEKGDEEGPKDAEEKEEKEGEKDAEESESKEDEEGAMDYASIISPDEDEGEEPTFTAIDALALIGKIAPAVAKSNNQAAADALNTLRDKLTLVRDGAKDGRPDPFRALASAGVNDSAGDEPDMLSFFNGRSYQDGLKAWNDHLSQRGK